MFRAMPITYAEESTWEGQILLGDKAKQTGEIARAKELYEKAIELAGDSLREDKRLADVWRKLGDIHSENKDYNEAARAYKRDLNIMVFHLGPDDPQITESMNRLAWCHLHLADGWPIAQALYYRVLEIQEKAFGTGDLRVADSLQNYASSLDFPQNGYRLAIPFLLRSLEIRENHLGKDHPKVADSLIWLAFIHDLNGRYDEAKPLYEQALSIRERTLAPDDPEVLNLTFNLGMLFVLQRDKVDGGSFFRTRISNLEQYLGPNHPETAKLLALYSTFLKNTGQEQEARKIDQRIEAIRSAPSSSSQP
jgi:tetratricopeptide (TPR) repeat protein